MDHPFQCTKIVQNIISKASLADIAKLRQVSEQLYYLTRSKYFDLLQREIEIDFKEDKDGRSLLFYLDDEDETDPSMSYMYRTLVLSYSGSSTDQNLRRNETCVINFLNELAPFITKLVFNFEDSYKLVNLKNFQSENSECFQNLLSIFTKLKEFHLHCSSLSISTSYKRLLSLLPASVNLHICLENELDFQFNPVFIRKLDDSINKFTNLKCFYFDNYQVTNETELETFMAQCERIVKRVELKINVFAISLTPQKFTNEVRLKTLIGKLCLFSRNLNVYQKGMSPKWDLMEKEYYSTDTAAEIQITGMRLNSYEYPLHNLDLFPNLGTIILDFPDINKCIFSDTNISDEENIRNVFGKSKKKLELELWGRSYTPGADLLSQSNPIGRRNLELLRGLVQYAHVDLDFKSDSKEVYESLS